MKGVITCENFESCGNEEFAEGNCPNEIMETSGYIQSNQNDSHWFCSKKCQLEVEEEECNECGELLSECNCLNN